MEEGVNIRKSKRMMGDTDRRQNVDATSGGGGGEQDAGGDVPVPVPMPVPTRRRGRDLQRLRQGLLLGPVTALTFFSSSACCSSPSCEGGEGVGAAGLYLLAGEDAYLAVYEVSPSSLSPSSSPSAPSDVGKPCGRIRVFSAQAIHGFYVGGGGGDSEGPRDGGNADVVLVWGGRSVAAVPRAVIERLIQSSCSCPSAAAATVDTEASPVKEVQAPDWIYDGILSQQRRQRGVLVTAHNEVVPFRVVADEGSSTFAIELDDALVSSPSRPMLYSAGLAWLAGERGEEDYVLVAAGTVFGEIVVWKCRARWSPLPLNEDLDGGLGPGGECEVLHVFAGHEGSVFGVSISPEVELGGEVGRFLASCSDDRTVRVWDITATTTTQRHPSLANSVGSRNAAVSASIDGAPGVASQGKMEEARETGFTNDLATVPTQTGSVGAGPSSEKPLATVMSHISRIWHVKFACQASTDNDTPDRILLYSFGEDATAQEWRLDLDLPHWEASCLSSSHISVKEGLPTLSLGKLTQIRTISCHSGKNIWAAAVLSDRSRCPPLVATGGADGKITLIGGENLGSCKSSDDNGVGTSSREMGTTIALTVPEVEALAFDGGKNSSTRADLPGTEASRAPLKEITPNSARRRRGGKHAGQDVFHSYAFISEDELLATTVAGRIFLGSFAEDAKTTMPATWAEVRVPEAVTADLRDYHVLRATGRGLSSAVIGTATGHLYMYMSSSRQVVKVADLPRKIEDVFMLPPSPCSDGEAPSSPPPSPPLSSAQATIQGGRETTPSSAIRLLVSMTLQQDRVLLEVDSATGEIVPGTNRGLIRLDDEDIIMSAAVCGDSHLVLGSRKGYIYLFRQLAGGYFAPEADTRIRIPTRDAVTAVVPLPPPVVQKRKRRLSSGRLPSSASFLATSRDGKYRIYQIVPQEGESSSIPSSPPSLSPSIVLRHEATLPFGPVVLDAWFIDQDSTADQSSSPDLVLCGFRGTKFVVWNETRQHEVAVVERGGTHRTNAYVLGGSSGGSGGIARLRFAFTSNAVMHVYSQAAAPTRTLRAGTHGREIRAATWSGGRRHLATGGEDTIIRIWEYGGDDGLRCLSVINKHNTGLQCLKWLDDDGGETEDDEGAYLVSSAGNEEMFVWRVARLDSRYAGLAVLCESAYPDRTRDSDLRITSFDVSPAAGEGMHITLALSNSTLKTYRYSRGGGWALAAQGLYTGACPMQVRHLPWSGSGYGSDGKFDVLTAYTDGNLSVQRVVTHASSTATTEEKPEPPRFRGYALLLLLPGVHKSAIKCLDFAAITTPANFTATPTPTGEEVSRSWIVLTGGDDNALGITCMTAARPGSSHGGGRRLDLHEYSVLARYRIPSAHAAALTGVRILGVEKAEEEEVVTAVTCSSDQRVKMWRLRVQTSSSGDAVAVTGVQLVDNRYSAVADPNDLEVVGTDAGKAVMVVGVGMETWRYQA